MFIIPRAKGESIVIGDDLLVTVIEVEDDEVRLSVERLSGQTDGSCPEAVLAETNSPSKNRPR